MSRAMLLALLLCVVIAAWAQPEPTPLPRDVTVTVTDYRGNPVPNAEVTATYCLNGEIIYRTATADAKGNVLWKALPAARVIVWGDGVPAKLFSPKTTTLQPLPPDVAQQNVTFEAPVPGVLTGPVSCRFWSDIVDSGAQPFPRGGTRNGKPVQSFSMMVTCAQRCSVLITMPGNPTHVALLERAYIPYIDEPNAKPYLTLPIRRMATVDCRFILEGKPVTVSHFEVRPVTIQRPWPDSPTFQDGLARLMKPQRTADGYRLTVPGGGRYRLLVDTYDETTQPFPGSVIDVPEEGKAVEIPLPAPLFSVPAGAEINWTTRNAPAKGKSLIAAADSKPMPIFGPKDGIYAAWYRSTPDTLQVYHGDTGKLTTHALLRSSITIDADGGPTSMFISIAPMLLRDVRLTRNIYGQEAYENLYQLNSHLFGKRLEFGQNVFPFIWSGKYLLSYASQYRVAEITEQKASKITWEKEDNPGGLRTGYRYLMIETPKELPAGAAAVQNPAALVFADDTRAPRGGNVMLRQGGGGTNFAIPVETKTLTFYAPGIGIIRNVPVPPAGDPKASILLQGWQPGVTVAGQLLDEAGQPLANTALRLNAEFEYAGMPETTTDAQGKFRFANLLPGIYFVTAQPRPAIRSMERSFIERTDTCWTLQVPEAGLPDAVLSVKDGIRINTGGYGRDGLWWFPAKGAPMRLAAIDQARYCSLTLGDGMLWFKESFNREESMLRRCMLQPGPDMLAINDGYQDQVGSYLGLFVSLKGANYYPDDIELIGLDKLAGFSVHFDGNHCWQPSPELGITAAQLGPFPTGKYHVIIGTGDKQISKEVTITENGANVTLP